MENVIICLTTDESEYKNITVEPSFGKYREFQKELYNFKSLYNFIR
jgi:hypothetical protein